MGRLKRLAMIATAWGVGLFAATSRADPMPLINAHAHNDYEHARPLFDALDRGFCSVEADIYLVDGQLLVAHDRAQVSPARTLQALYLDPLRERVRKNGGKVYPNGPECTLLIDIKSEGEKVYPVLREVLKGYAEMLTVFRPDKTETKAITVILSGSRPTAMLANEPLRYAAIDGRLPDLDQNPSRHLVPLVSDDWSRLFHWRGAGPLPPEEKQKLREFVKQAHQQDRRIRFWGAPDNVQAWQELHRAGVDLLNTDDLAGMQKFFAGQKTGTN
jgi:hypothetical protein